MKHIGRQINPKRRCVVAYRVVPKEADQCLVVFTDSLESDAHDALMNLVEIFNFSSSLLIRGPPPCTTTIESPNLFKILISLMKLLNIFSFVKTLPPNFITIISFLYFSTYLFIFFMSGAEAGQIFLISFKETFSDI